MQERLDFSFDPDSDKRYLVLFDLAGSGELQFLYPLQAQGDSPALAKIPYDLPLVVEPPSGEDDLVAVFCATAQDRLATLLSDYHGRTPPRPEDFLAAVGQDCQIGRYAFFTGE
jgi:hypothetical protein